MMQRLPNHVYVIFSNSYIWIVWFNCFNWFSELKYYKSCLEIF